MRLRSFSWFAPLALAVAVASCTDTPTAPGDRPAPEATVPAPAFNVVDGQGLIWRDLSQTAGLSWNAVAQRCPTDGVNPCYGSVGAVDLSGWVWATESQVVQLISHYEPAILGSLTLVGAQYASSVNAFFADFPPTISGGCSGYICSFSSFTSGWTATSHGPGTAVQATVTGGLLASPSFQVGSDPNVALSSSARGHFLWRLNLADGSGVNAVDDFGTVDSPTGGVAVANVLANDLLGAAPATLDNVTLTQLTSSLAQASLDPATGTVTVGSGVKPGSATLTYRICETARPSNCDVATVTITIAGNVIDAVDDAGSAYTGGGIAIADLLANDRLGGVAPTPASVAVTVLTSDPSLSVNGAAQVIVAAGTAPGLHSLQYRICEIANPINCDQAVADVTVLRYPIDAVEDQSEINSYPGGVAIPSVLANDTFSGGAASLATVKLTVVGTVPAGLGFDLATGSVSVAAGTPGGLFQFTYQICEIAAPTNCDQAVAKVKVVPLGYTVSNDSYRIDEGSSGSFNVSLNQPPTQTITVTVAYLNGTLPVTVSPATLTFGPANWNRPQSVSFSTKRDSDKIDNAGTVTLTASGVAIRPVVIAGIDRDRKGNFPTALLQAPLNGATVSGMVSMWGTATSTGGTLVDGKFSIDGNRIATVTGSSGTYRPAAWNSATVANGWHTVEFRATDSAGGDGRMTIMIFVAN